MNPEQRLSPDDYARRVHQAPSLAVLLERRPELAEVGVAAGISRLEVWCA